MKAGRELISDALFWIGITLTIWSAKINGYGDTAEEMSELRKEGGLKGESRHDMV